MLLMGSFTFAETVRVGIYDNAPLLGVDENGVEEGFFIDVFDQIGTHEGWDVVYVLGQLDETLTKLENGEVDLILGIAYSEARSERFKFNEEEVFLNWGTIFVGQDSTIESLTDLSGKIIGVQKGDIHYIGEKGIKNTLEEFNIDVTYKLYDDKLDILADIESGVIDAGVMNRTFGAERADEYDVDNMPIQFNPIKMHIIGTNQTVDILSVVDQHLSHLRQDSESVYYSSLNKHFGESAPIAVSQSVRYLIVVLATLLMGSVLVVIYGRRTIERKTEEIRQFNKTLEDKIAQRTEEIELKHAELLESEKMASLGRMMSSVTHEIEIPVISAITETMNVQKLNEQFKSEFSKDSIKKSDVQIYYREVNAICDNIKFKLKHAEKYLRDFGDIAADRRNDILMTVNIKNYIEKLVYSYQPELDKQGHMVEMNIPDLELKIYPGDMSLIMMNLIKNSLEHGFRNTENGNIKISVGVDKQNIYIIFADNGIGIDEEHIGKIFDPFYTTRSEDGFKGLGLSVVYNIILNRMKGSIRCVTGVGKGTEFGIKIPRVDEDK
jgi:signal transduction histidine kinase